MSISFKYENTFKNAMFNWFSTIFSLGAPEETEGKKSSGPQGKEEQSCAAKLKRCTKY